MRNFWALPAFLRIALASPHSFSVFEDLLAFPQVRICPLLAVAPTDQCCSTRSSFLMNT
jgi:hypothetical protein